jgi:hypothetical protein
VATGNTRKRTTDESIADCIEIGAVKRPCAVSATNIEYDHAELEESDMILAPNSRWEDSESLSLLTLVFNH